MIPIKQSTSALAIPFIMIDSDDHITGKTGLSPTVTLSKNGAAFVSASGSVTDRGNGVYWLNGDTTDSNTVGAIWLHAEASGADPTDAFVAYVESATNADIYARIGAPVGASISADIATLPTGNENADALLDRSNAVDTYTPRQALRVGLAADAGKTSGMGVGSPVIRSANDTKARITATVDGDGNRTAITIDAT